MIWVTAILGHFGWLGEEHSHPNGEQKEKQMYVPCNLWTLH